MRSSLFLSFSLSLFASCTLAADLPSFSDVLSKHENLTTFKNTLENSYPELLARLEKQTSSSSPITILAPNNDAFSKATYYPVVGPAFDNGDMVTIQNILNYHVVLGSVSSDDLLPTFQYFPTWLNNATMSNVTAGQRIGGVMQNEKEMIWVSAQSSRSPAVETDIEFAGGILHIVSSLCTPPTRFPNTAALFSTAAEPLQLTSFLGATYYSANKTVTDVAALLNSTSDLTIFAPNNAALNAINTALTDLSKDPSALSALLKYHIVHSPLGPWYSTNFTDGSNSTTLTTLTGESLTISFSSNSLFVNSARILTQDLLITNGVMHVIDTVLDPEDAAKKPEPTRATQLPLYSADSKPSVSQAPFTTWMPWVIVTEVPQAAASSGAGYYGGGKTKTTTGYRGVSATSTSRGDAVTGRVGGSGGLEVVFIGIAMWAARMLL
jgi:uncharacterized surface protein with fasciclin (FAS1) repeats